MPSRYNLRSHDSSKDSDQDTKSPPQKKAGSPKSPNQSGYNSSASYRDQSSRYDDDLDHFSDSQEEDETDYSYPSTAFSPTASTPSPSLHHRGVTGRHDGKTPPSGRSLYPDLSDLSEKTPSPSMKQKRAEHSPVRKQKTSIKTVKTEPSTDPSMLVIGVIGVVGILILMFLFGGSTGHQKSHRTSEFQEFVSKVDNLQTSFKSQEKRTWRSIKSSVKHILNSTDPEYPAVVMFAVKKDMNTVGSCLARKVASLFNSVTTDNREDGYLDARLLSHLESAKQKEDLDEKIHSNFKIGRSVVIDHLEALSPTASLLLHGICDNDNAPFKNVFIGIVFYVDKNLKAPDVDTELSSYFSKELDMDKIGALLTRINNNAVVVMKEETLDLSVCD